MPLSKGNPSSAWIAFALDNVYTLKSDGGWNNWLRGNGLGVYHWRFDFVIVEINPILGCFLGEACSQRQRETALATLATDTAVATAETAATDHTNGTRHWCCRLGLIAL
jgi:hypothetical protein